ncbi:MULTISPECIES: hypothetical protein [Streptosporangium]|uniref:Uncharacterized protein n=1 Tax=Streptosporangium brasiliense TaxID=47480 RepID=A0ABT9RM94_9ACTN|nr:hypothetical protein [Streptosporangium brasiliense]MDP9870375.1 hypothetical protein [Streptosporangium brasiliense]
MRSTENNDPPTYSSNPCADVPVLLYNPPASTTSSRDQVAYRQVVEYLRANPDVLARQSVYTQRLVAEYGIEQEIDDSTKAYVIVFGESSPDSDESLRDYVIGVASSRQKAKERLGEYLLREYPGKTIVQTADKEQELHAQHLKGRRPIDVITLSADGMAAFVGYSAFHIIGYEMDGELQ